MFCAQCGAMIKPQDGQNPPVCEQCGAIGDSRPVLSDEGVREEKVSGYSCPICAIPLMEAALATEQIHFCDKCRGMLVSMGSFLEIVGILRTQVAPGTVFAIALNPEELRRKINCPICHAAMDTHPYGGPGNIVMDSCENCLLNWLDHGEMTQIAAASNAGSGIAPGDGGFGEVPSIAATGRVYTPSAFDNLLANQANNLAIEMAIQRRRSTGNGLFDLAGFLFGR